MVSEISPSLHLLLGDKNAICPNIGIVTGRTASLFVDLSNRQSMLEEALEYLPANGYPPLRYVLFTHFHDDHIANLQFLPEGIELLSSKNTSRYLSRPSTIVKENTQIDLGEHMVSIIKVPSLHAKGCLALLNDDYLFIGDSLAPREGKDGLYFDSSIAFEMEKAFKEIPFKEAIQGHPASFIKKDDLLTYLKTLHDKGWGGVRKQY